MNHTEFERLEQIHNIGRTHFVFGHGAFLFGLPIGLVLAIIDVCISRAIPHGRYSIILDLMVGMVVGILISPRIWRASETKFYKLRNDRLGPHN